MPWLYPGFMEQVRGQVRLLALLLFITLSFEPLGSLTSAPLIRKQVDMESQKAVIERSNRKSIEKVDVQVTVTNSGSGRQSWRGEFMSRTADGFLPSERIWLTLDNGQRGMASISETHFNSRTPDATLIQFVGKGPLA
ncbi:MAG TPA: hypothetical protein VE420_05460 [Gemmatimonadales bacterium]|nr:hypothetical protein [Gemmatimonadales bacterium]